jgi:hypothetical protein
MSTSTAVQLKARSASSYLQEYQLLTTKEEINAYWERMDSIIANMNIEDKTLFFSQLENDIDTSKSQLDKLLALVN